MMGYTGYPSRMQATRSRIEEPNLTRAGSDPGVLALFFGFAGANSSFFDLWFIAFGFILPNED